jgi:hypothetical protein
MLTLGLLAMPSVSIGVAKPAPPPLQDSVVGTGTFITGVGEAGFDFAATSGPTGEDPMGHVIFTLPDLRIQGTVGCLRIISPSSAVVGINTAAGSAFVGVTDGPDQFIVLFGFTPGPIGPGDCPPTILGGGSSLLVTSGHLVITDAQPLPTSTDQCKNDGWAQFGFVNQGQCVAFVQRAPKP